MLIIIRTKIVVFLQVYYGYFVFLFFLKTQAALWTFKFDQEKFVYGESFLIQNANPDYYRYSNRNKYGC